MNTGLEGRDGYFVSMDDDQKMRTEFWLVDGVLHREDAPALIVTDIKTGVIVREESYKDGGLHSYRDQAAVIMRNLDGRVHERCWFVNNGRDRDPQIGPAYERYYRGSNCLEEIIYQRDDKFHRPLDQGPAIIAFLANGEIESAQYWVDGRRVEDLEAFRPGLTTPVVDPRLANLAPGSGGLH